MVNLGAAFITHLGEADKLQRRTPFKPCSHSLDPAPFRLQLKFRRLACSRLTNGAAGVSAVIDETFTAEPVTVVSGMWDAWSRRDLAGTLAFFDAQSEYAMFIPEEVLPFGGTTTGIRSIADRLQTILDQFDTLRYDPRSIRPLGNTVSAMVDYVFRHKVTGETLEGSMRHVATVRNGRLVRLEEYHDVALVRAFMRLVAHAATKD